MGDTWPEHFGDGKQDVLTVELHALSSLRVVIEDVSSLDEDSVLVGLWRVWIEIVDCKNVQVIIDVRKLLEVLHIVLVARDIKSKVLPRILVELLQIDIVPEVISFEQQQILLFMLLKPVKKLLELSFALKDVGFI